MLHNKDIEQEGWFKDIRNSLGLWT